MAGEWHPKYDRQPQRTLWGDIARLWNQLEPLGQILVATVAVFGFGIAMAWITYLSDAR